MKEIRGPESGLYNAEPEQLGDGPALLAQQESAQHEEIQQQQLTPKPIQTESHDTARAPEAEKEKDNEHQAEQGSEIVHSPEQMDPAIQE